MRQPSDIPHKDGTFVDALQAHKDWINGNGGERLITPWGVDLSGVDLSGVDLSDAALHGADLARADLRGAVLRRADLSGAVLRGVDLSDAVLNRAVLNRAVLRRADLRDVDLRGADLRGVDLRRADLSGVDLRRADLSGAVLRGAVLRGAVLRGVDLRGADLRGAVLSDAVLRGVIADYLTTGYHLACPESGAFDGWKKCRNGVIAKLLIPADAKRSSATTRKCRAEYVKVLQVIGADHGVASHDNKTVYRVGETVRCHEWGEDRWNECSGGIHFFLTRAEAEAWQQ